MGSDRLKGSTSKYHQPTQGSQGQSGGPWRGIDSDHYAFSHGGGVRAGAGDAVRNVKSNDHRRSGHQRKSSPPTTHLRGGAVLAPKRAVQQPVSEKRKRGVRRG